MDSIEIWLLAISLAMDCFTVSVTSGIILHKIQWNILLKMAFFFGLFQAAMPLLGWLGISLFSDSIKAYDHWIAFGLLFYIGIHKYGAPGSQIHRGLRKEGFFGKALCGVAQRGGEVLNKGAAAGGAGLV